jgi:hypothetical protein
MNDLLEYVRYATYASKTERLGFCLTIIHDWLCIPLETAPFSNVSVITYTGKVRFVYTLQTSTVLFNTAAPQHNNLDNGCLRYSGP